MSTYGIDLGTIYSCIAWLDSKGNPEVIRNNEDDSNTVARVVFFENEKNAVVGQGAKENVETKQRPGRSIRQTRNRQT